MGRFLRLLAVASPLGLVLIAAVLAYENVGNLPFTFWDDPSYVTMNEMVEHPLAKGWDALFHTKDLGYPIPITILSFALDRRLFGLNPKAFHLVNLGFHLVNIVLLFALARRMGFAASASAKVAGLFGLHPLAVEPVAWVTGRKDLLAVGLILAAMLVVLGRRRDQEPPSVPRWLAVHLLCVVAMMAKPSALAAPALLFVVVAAARPLWNRLEVAVALVPQVAAAGLLALVGMRGQKAIGAEIARSFSEGVGDVFSAALLQLQHLVWPRHLLTTYHRSPDDPSWGALLIVAAFVVTAGFWVHRHAAPRSPLRTGLLLALVSYLPASDILANARWTADSWMYLPMIGIAIAVVAAAETHALTSFVAWPLLGLLALASHEQARMWQTSTGLFKAVADYYPEQPWPLNRLAFAYLSEQNFPEANRVFVQLEEKFPAFPKNQASRAGAFDELGLHDRAEAIMARCVSDLDEECGRNWWMDVLNGKRAADPAKRDLFSSAYKAAAKSLREGVADGGFRMIANTLRQLGLQEQAADADRIADEKARGIK